MKMIVLTSITMTVLTFMGSFLFVYSGLYPVGADEPHFDVTSELLTIVRENSIARAAAEIKVPDLKNPQMLIRGGSDYAAMCASCHLKPGQYESDLSLGLYPAPPNLAYSPSARLSNRSPDTEAARQFWVIKHGIKASGMPAWGMTHDDQRIWDMVAFLRRLPRLTPEQYQILTGRANALSPSESHGEH